MRLHKQTFSTEEVKIILIALAVVVAIRLQLANRNGRHYPLHHRLRLQPKPVIANMPLADGLVGDAGAPDPVLPRIDQLLGIAQQLGIVQPKTV